MVCMEFRGYDCFVEFARYEHDGSPAIQLYDAEDGAPETEIPHKVCSGRKRHQMREDADEDQREIPPTVGSFLHRDGANALPFHRRGPTLRHRDPLQES